MSENAKLLGEYLKAKREENDLSINQLADKLKVSKNVVNHIEVGEKSKDNAYMRLIIKKYAKSIGLKENEYLDMLDKAYPSIVEQTTDLSDQMIIKKKKEKTKSGVTKFLITVIFIIIIIILLLFTTYNIKSSVEKGNENETTLIEDTTLKPQNIEKKKDQTKSDKEDKLKISQEIISENQIQLSVDTDKDFELKIKATSGEAYTDVSVNGVMEDSKTLSEGDSKTYKIQDNEKENTIINIGNINACDLYINDQKISKDQYTSSQQYISFN